MLRRMAREPLIPAAEAISEIDHSPSVPSGPKPSKIGTVLALLRRAEGATISDLTEATGWLAHTTRAALTGLRKKGHALEKTKRDGVTCYRISDPADDQG